MKGKHNCLTAVAALLCAGVTRAEIVSRLVQDYPLASIMEAIETVWAAAAIPRG